LSLTGGRRRGGGAELKKRMAVAQRLGEAEGKIKKEKVRVLFHFSHFSGFVCV